MIPKIIHFVWIGPPMPAWAERNVEEFRRLNPGYEVRLHGEEALLPDYRTAYAARNIPANKSDLLRYSALERWGGWYFDCDMFPLRPLDEAVQAWRLDGRKLYLARMDRTRPINGAVLAAAADSPAWPEIRARIPLAAKDKDFKAVGPSLLSSLAAERPDLVEVAGKAWWYGADERWAAKLRRRVLAGDLDIVRRFDPETGGQLPFALHLWAYQHADKVAAGEGDGRPLAVLADPRRVWPTTGAANPFAGLAKGFERLGFRVETHDVSGGKGRSAVEEASDVPAVAAVWNGMKTALARDIGPAQRLGIPVLRLELGFFDRNHHYQVDHAGILHRASWRRAVLAGAPSPPAGVPSGGEGAAKRLAAFLPRGVSPQKHRKGYVLVLGQTTGDSQLADSEIQGPLQIQKAVMRGLPAGVKAYFRPHPQTSHMRINSRHTRLPQLPDQQNERGAYAATKQGAGLAAALAGAAFVVTINSNAMTEALAAGVPCLAFGPSLGIDAGAVHPTSLATLRKDLAEMLGGWRAPDAAVRRYLEWLAARQWSAEELADPAVLGPLLRAAGVDIPALMVRAEAAA